MNDDFVRQHETPPVTELEFRLHFEELLSCISASFVNLPSGMIDREIDHWLKELVEFLGVDRITVAQFSRDEVSFIITHSYGLQDVENPPLQLAYYSWYTDVIKSGELLVLENLPDDLPETASEERGLVNESGLKSHVGIPLTAGGKVLGMIGMGAYARSRHWPRELVQRLRLVGEVFANAILREHLTEELDDLWEELAHASRVSSMGEIAATLAHELNQPLAAILSNAQAARRFLEAGKPDIESVREIIADIIADDRRAGEVIRNVRRFLGKQELERTSLALNEVIDEVLMLFEHRISNRSVTVVRQIEENLPPVVANRIQIEQVILNLLMNSMEAMEELEPAERRITVRSFREEPGMIGFAVCDSGIGFDRTAIEKAFEAFFTTKPAGMGMGLAISRSIIESHGGKLYATENPECGATLSFCLPVRREKAHE